MFCKYYTNNYSDVRMFKNRSIARTAWIHVHASICNISIAQPTGLGYNVTDRLINKHNTATNFIFEYVWANQKYFKENFVLMNNKNVILYNVYIISREKNPHIPEVTSQVTKRLIGNIPLTNGFECYKFIELFYIK